MRPTFSNHYTFCHENKHLCCFSWDPGRGCQYIKANVFLKAVMLLGKAKPIKPINWWVDVEWWSLGKRDNPRHFPVLHSQLLLLKSCLPHLFITQFSHHQSQISDPITRCSYYLPVYSTTLFIPPTISFCGNAYITGL